ncbi:hypothetical protein MAPG_01435 [Magnaporthiopsis poae ATCC 64411]|uniref:Tyrosinase copper-binding domain-containing protein n=1 Tax=Magnaporthiopsis poae (strain ATCC 64411 / 73-15) TaxID=644358 RepID=A0A0C4DNP1_MAGP6|nr:hypothetical protein MAPG_01435 [Magnaporthiopsis poae ATCC 64411]
MHAGNAIIGAVLVLGCSVLRASAASPSAEDLIKELNSQAIANLEQADHGAAEKRACSIHNTAIRRDWATLTKCERKDYIKAVKCLMAKPSKSPSSFAPGARSRFDDFVAVHINQTLSIHGTGNFLTYHRYITWAYEQALRNECGYKGYQPYWNWFTYTDDPTKSPLFDGSPTSLSGDGQFLQHNGTLAGAGKVWLPSGKGGGCLKSGPFADVKVNLGPVRPGQDGLKPSPTGNLGPNPRCISRDLNPGVLQRWMTYENLLNVTVGAASHSVGAFQDELQGRFGDGFLGMHATGHMAIGGESTDLFSSINDPSFYLHHAMLDRVYWLWQALHPDKAADIDGTITVLNNPPSRKALKTDLIIMGVNAETRPIADLFNTLGASPFCYIYM